MAKVTLGTNSYDSDKLSNVLFNNTDAYAQHQRMSDADVQEFKSDVGYTIDGIKNGTITIGTDGKMYDKNGRNSRMMPHVLRYINELMHDSGSEAIKYKEAEKKKYNRNLDDDFKQYFNAGNDPDEDFLKSWTDKDTVDENGNRATANRALAYSQMLQDKLNRIQNDEYDMEGIDKDTEIRNISAAIEALKDGVISDNEISILGQAGHQANLTKLLFTNGNVTKTPDWIKTRKEELKAEGYNDSEINQIIEEEKEEKRWDREDAREEKRLAHEEKVNNRLAKQHEQTWRDYANQVYTGNFNKRSWNLGKSSFATAADYENALVKTGVNPDKYYLLWINNPDGSTNGHANKDWLKNYLKYTYDKNYDKLFVKDLKDENGTESGLHILRDSVNYRTGKALAFDHNSRKLIEISPRDSFTLRDMLRTNWYNNNPVPNASSSSGKIFKEGGILEYQEGGQLPTLEELQAAVQAGQITPEQAQIMYSKIQQSTPVKLSIRPVTDYSSKLEELDTLNTAKKNVTTRQLSALKSRADKKGRTVEAQKYYEGTGDFTTADWIRMGALANDIASVATSYAAGTGTAIAGIQGLASTAADLVADAIDPNVKEGQWKDNLMSNLGFTALGMLPGGSGKIGKIWKGVKKLAPLAMSTSGFISAINDPEIQATWKKVFDFDSPEKLTNQDWLNIAHSLKMAAFTHNTGRAASQAYNQTIRETEWAPSILRKFGEIRDENIGKLNNLQNLASSDALVAKTKGNTITIKTAEGDKTLKLTKEAVKEINNVANQHKDNAEAALKAVNDLVHRKVMAKDIKFSADLKDATFKQESLPATKEKLSDLVVKIIKEDGKTELESLKGYLGTITPKDGKYQIKLNNDKPFTLEEKEFKDLKAIIDAASPDAMTKFNTKWKEIYTGDRVLEQETPGALKDFVTTLGVENFKIPEGISSKLGKSIKVKLGEYSEGNTLSERSKAKISNYWKQLISGTDPFEGDSEAAIANRALLEEARSKYKNTGLLANNWEMAQGVGPFWHVTDKKEKGGTIQFAKEGTTVNNMGFSNNKGTWRKDIFDKYSKDLLTRLNSAEGQHLDDLVSMINNMQDAHYGIYTKHGTDFNKGVSYDQDVYDYQNKYDNYDAFGYNKREGVDAINQAYKAGRYSPIGHATRTSGDGAEGSFKNDGFYGAITDDRRILGRKGSDYDDWDEQSINAFNNAIKNKGLKLFLDTKTNYYKIGRIPQNPQQGSVISEAPDQSTSKWDKYKKYGMQILEGLNDQKGNILEGANYLDSLRTNKKAYDAQLKGLGISLLSPVNSHLTQKSDILAQQAAQQNAGKLNSQARTAQTSDASLEAARQLEHAKAGTQGMLQAAMQSAQTAHETAMKNALLQQDNNKYNLNVKDTNNSKEQALNKEKASLDASYILADRTSRDNFLKSLIYEAKKDKVDRKAKRDALELFKVQNATSFDPDYQNKLKEYQRLNTKYSAGSLSKEETERMNTLGTELTTLGNQIQTNAYMKYLGGNDELLNPKSRYYFKDGGRAARIRARSHDDSEFNKIIQNNVKHFENASSTLSKITIMAMKKAIGL